MNINKGGGFTSHQSAKDESIICIRYCCVDVEWDMKLTFSHSSPFPRFTFHVPRRVGMWMGEPIAKVILFIA